MKRGIRFLSLILVFAMFLGITAIPASAGSTTRYTMNVGDTKTLYTNAGGKALKGASWTTSDYQSVAIVSQNDFSCEIEVIGPNTPAIAFRAPEMEDMDGVPLTEPRKPQMQFKMQLPAPVPPLSLIRRCTADHA